MHFKISQETLNKIGNFVHENLLCKHGVPIINELSNLEPLLVKAEEVVNKAEEKKAEANKK